MLNQLKSFSVVNIKRWFLRDKKTANKYKDRMPKHWRNNSEIK